ATSSAPWNLRRPSAMSDLNQFTQRPESLLTNVDSHCGPPGPQLPDAGLHQSRIQRAHGGSVRLKAKQDHGRQWKLRAFVLPSGIVVLSTMVYPLLYAAYISLFRQELGSASHTFVGLDNYVSLLVDERFWTSLIQTVLIEGASVTLEFMLGLVLAFGLYHLTAGARVFNLLLFLPHVVTPVVAAL